MEWLKNQRMWVCDGLPIRMAQELPSNREPAPRYVQSQLRLNIVKPKNEWQKKKIYILKITKFEPIGTAILFGGVI